MRHSRRAAPSLTGLGVPRCSLLSPGGLAMRQGRPRFCRRPRFWRLGQIPNSTTKAGRPGTDNESARQFSANLDSNLDYIAHQVRDGKYGFSKLHAVFLPKPDSDVERVICIPTVRDRLVQRAIGEYITSKSIFPIYNSSSFGFIKGLGPHDAIRRTLELRKNYQWCLKTDIQSFFDKISRSLLKKQISKDLNGNSLEALVLKAVDCEAKSTSLNKEKLQKQGLTPGVGIRQGMPLSPLLANLRVGRIR